MREALRNLGPPTAVEYHVPFVVTAGSIGLDPEEAPCHVPRALRDVVFVDGVRTPFGKAGPKGIYAETRADDLVVKCIRELLRRNPQLPPERVDEVAIAATTQIGDQGLTIGRTRRAARRAAQVACPATRSTACAPAR